MKKTNAYLTYTVVVSCLLLLNTFAKATNCVDAIPLLVFPVINQSVFCGANNDLSQTTVPDVCDGVSNYYKNGKEALYRFTPPSSGTYTISYIGGYYTSIFVYDGCPNEGGVCIGGIGSTPDSKVLNANLLSSQTYYIWFDNESYNANSCPGLFSIVLLPSNDNCAGAIPFPAIEPDNTCASLTVTTITTAIGPVGPCGGYPDDDMWYTFTTPPNVSKIHYNSTLIFGSADLVFQVYEGTCNGGLPSLGCFSEESGIISGLSGNTTYYMRVYNTAEVQSSIFNLCLRTVLPNDDCAGAIAFPALTTDGNCATMSVNTENALGNTSELCAGIADDDLWFSFSVPSGVNKLLYDITNISGNQNISFLLYAGSCDAFWPVCYKHENGLITGLSANTTYYMRIFTEEAGTASVFDICLRTLLPPANDACEGAISIGNLPQDGSCVMTTVSTFGATNTSTAICITVPQDDVWYTFTMPPGSTSLYYSMTNILGSSDRVLQIYSGTCPGALTSLDCFDSESGTITELVGNTTYYLRLSSHSSQSFTKFNLCLRVPPPPVNDLCSGAIAFPDLSLDNNCAGVTVVTSNATGTADPTCTGTEDDDVWFTFTTPPGVSSVFSTIIDMWGSTNRAFQVFQGTCDDLVSIGCNENISGAVITGLSGNTTYFLRVYTGPSNVSSSFQICLSPLPSPPPNDECNNAISFPDIPIADSSVSVTFTTLGATGTPTNTCTGTEDDDVWLRFVVPPGISTLFYETTTLGGDHEVYFQLFRGECDNLSSVQCYNGTNGYISNLISGDAYYIRFFTKFANVSGTYRLSLRTGAINDECIYAIPFPEAGIDDGCSRVTIDPQQATPSVENNYTNCLFVDYNDLWYSFSVPEGVTQIRYIFKNGFLPYGKFQLFTGDCSGLVSVGCYNNFSGIITGLVSGVTYYLRAYYGYSYQQGEKIDLCLFFPPPNDECSRAIAFPSIPTDSTCAVVTANTFGAFGPSNDPTCTGAEDDDIWFTFTTPPDVTALFYNIPYELNNVIYLQLFSGAECSGLTSIGCYTAASEYLTGLTGNTTYYLRLYSPFAGDMGRTFDICLSLPASNDDCTGAIAFPDLPFDGSCASVASSTRFASGTPDASCTGYEDDDVWFTFATSSGVKAVYYQVFTDPVNRDMTFQLYSGECNNLTLIGCYDPSEGVIKDLNPGTTYYLRLYSWQEDVGYDFSICLRPEPLNDDCMHALAFPDIPIDGSCTSVIADTRYATGTLDATCAGAEDDDVWFTFTTPPGVTQVAYQDSIIYGSFFSARLQIFSGECDNLTSIGCYNEEDGVITGLNGSTTYYLRVYSTNTGSSQLDRAIIKICLNLQVSANDECSGALPFPAIPADGSCAVMNISTKFATGSADPTCMGTEDDDLWYTFTTPPGVTSLVYQMDDEVYNLYFQIFRNTCNNLVSIGCYTTHYGVITGLSGGTTYRLRAYTDVTGASYTGDFCLRRAPVNSYCGSAFSFPAIPLDGSCASVTGHTVGVTGGNGSNCIGTEDDNVWYSFTTPPNVTKLAYNITRLAPSQSDEDMVLEISMGSCGSLTGQTCYDAETGTLNGLMGNTTYYMRVYTKSSNSNSIFSICLKAVMFNDDCIGAIAFPALPIDGSCATTAVFGANATPSGLPSCISSYPPSLDVWYTFTTPLGAEEAVAYQVSGFPSTYPFELQIFSGACGTLNPLGCYSTESGVFAGLSGGTTYYLRTYVSPSTANPSFNICLRIVPPGNDLCQGASAFPEIPEDGSCAMVTVHTQGATDNGDPTCAGDGYDDVWFTFTTPPGVTYLQYEISNITGSPLKNFQILDGSCGQLIPIGCYSNDYGVIDSLTGNTTYYVRAYNYDSSNTAFSLCLRLPMPGDNCLDAQLIERCSNTLTLSGSFAAATEDGLTNGCGAYVYPSVKGVWYRFVGDGLPTTLHTNIDSEETGILVYSGSCESLSCVIGNEYEFGYSSQVSWVANAGENYYIYLFPYDDFDVNPMGYTLSLIGDVVCPAVINPTVTNISNNSATISWPGQESVQGYEYAISASEFCSYGHLTNTSENTVTLSGLIPDTTYIFCVRSVCECPGSLSTSISFKTLPQFFPNDYCTEAFTVYCGTAITGSTENAVPEQVSGNCDGGTSLAPGNGVWYKIVGDGTLITLDLCASAYDTRIHVFSGTCQDMVCVAANDNACGLQSKVSFHSVPNMDYFILISGTDTYAGDFTMSVSCICDEPLGTPWTATGIGGTQGIAINNYCDNRIDIEAEGAPVSGSNDFRFFAFQDLCDSMAITAKVSSISENGFAGIALRESSAPGARMVAIKVKKGKFVFREIRSGTDGAKSTQQFFTLNHKWLRLVRNGNNIIGYSSAYGINWQQHFSINLAMPSCLQAGLFVESTETDVLAIGSFSNVDISPSDSTIIMSGGDVPTGEFPSDMPGYMLYPNPAQLEINVKMDKAFIGQELIITINNQFGQMMDIRRIEEVQNLVETFSVQHLPPGIYIITLRTENWAVLSKKFMVSHKTDK